MSAAAPNLLQIGTVDMKKKVLILGLLLLGLCLLYACNMPSTNTSGNQATNQHTQDQHSEDEKIVLRFFHYHGEAEAAYLKVFAAYEAEHPNVTIESEFLNSENYNSTLDARIAVQDCPDIIGTHPGLAQAIPLAEAGYLADLTGQPCLTGIRESELQTATTENGTYAVPTDLAFICTFYNQDMFAAYDLAIPTTWEEFLDVCQTLKDNGITPIALGYKDMWLQSLIPYALAVTTIYKEQNDFDAQMREGTKHFNGPEWQETMQMVRTLVERGFVTPNYLQLTYEQQLAAFANEEAAMMIMGTWGLPLIRAINPACSVGLFITPGSDDGVNWISSSIGGMLAVNANSEHKEEAMDFLNFLLSNDEIYRQYILDTGGVPSRTDLNYTYDPALEALMADIPGSYPFLDINWPSKFQITFMQSVGEISTGRNIEDVLSGLDTLWADFYGEE